MHIIDSHCHLDGYIKNNELGTIIKNAKDASVNQMIAVGTKSADWSLYAQTASKHPGTIFYTVGLHPCYVTEQTKDTIDQLAPFFKSENKPIALGEIGLDHYHLPEDTSKIGPMKSVQNEVFEKQLQIAKDLVCPIVIHARNAFNEVVEVIDASGVNWSRVVFHCFSEGPDEIKMLNERGARGSFTGVITYKKAEATREAALAQGIDKFMLETDAPYLAPVPKRGKPNEPAYTRYIAEFCAQLFEMSLEDFSLVVQKNTKEFFKIS